MSRSTAATGVALTSPTHNANKNRSRIHTPNKHLFPPLQPATSSCFTTRDSNGFLASLPAVLFSLICSFLTLQDKFLSFACLNHAVKEQLSPACFTTNHLAIDKHCLAMDRNQWQDSMKLLLLITSVELAVGETYPDWLLQVFRTLTKVVRISLDLFFILPSSEQAMIAPSSFSHLTHLFLADLASVCTFSADTFPCLSTVAVRVERQENSLPMLQRRMDEIFALPALTTLDIQDSERKLFALRHEWIPNIPWQKLQKLTLKMEWEEGDEELFYSVIHASLQSTCKPCPLKHLQLSDRVYLKDASGIPSFGTLLDSLETLDLSGAWPRGLVSISCPPYCLPACLRHLLLPHAMYSEVLGREQKIYQATLVLLKTLAPRLTVLQCDLFDERRNWLEEPSLIEQVFSLTSLRWLSLYGYDKPERYYRLLAVAAQSCSSFLHLHSLGLYNFEFSHETLCLLLKNLPQLVDLVCDECGFVVTVIVMIGIHCQYIRSIRLSTTLSSWTMAGCVPPEFKQQLSQCVFTPFARLEMLQLKCDRRPIDSVTYSTAGLMDFLHVLIGAPLEYISFSGYLLTCEQLMLFAPFRTLSVLRVDHPDQFKLCVASDDGNYKRCSFVQKNEASGTSSSPADICLHGCAMSFDTKYAIWNLRRGFHVAVTKEEIPHLTELYGDRYTVRSQTDGVLTFRQSVHSCCKVVSPKQECLYAYISI